MKAIGSKKRLTDKTDKLALEFMKCIEDLLSSKEIQKLDQFVQHCNTSRLQHSLNVAYYGFLWAKKRGLDYKSVARAGILHDLYLYNRHNVKFEEHHAFYHPKEALKNAQKITSLNEIEKDAILNHMWPLSNPPKYKEGKILSWADKYCTIAEVVHQISKKIYSINKPKLAKNSN